ncbi:transporter [Ganoderma sinense ZZ0214-1]|uniref:Transporter n=1 Tax=Ganoderma sinense ZZ0214-1 TaxID=1077348 RepID=A0A2G8RVL4_9APHY|nr:transporter [Ganoderma sinense ZZ0214-1]
MSPQVGQITLYNNHAVFWCHRVRIALAQAGAEYTLYNVDLDNKPEWFNEKVNAAGKVPTLAYGGSQTLPEDPSPESAKLTESTVIVEFIADLFPAARLLPADPVLRARARHFVHHFDAKVAMPLLGFLAVGQSTGSCIDALEGLQALLPEHNEHEHEDGQRQLERSGPGFAFGEPSVADIAVAPFLITGIVLLENDIGAYTSEEGQRALEEIRSPRLARLRAYVEFLREWPAFKDTFDKATTLAAWRKAPRMRKRT